MPRTAHHQTLSAVAAFMLVSVFASSAVSAGGITYTKGFAPIDVSGIRMQQAHDPAVAEKKRLKGAHQRGVPPKGAAITSAAIMGIGRSNDGKHIYKYYESPGSR